MQVQNLSGMEDESSKTSEGSIGDLTEGSYSFSNTIKNIDGKPLREEENENKTRSKTSPKASSSTVISWLQENYEAAEGTSLPRSTLYTHYVGFCSSTSIEPVNAASFGKLIRSIFPNLKTRRLGTRGHSKYHYYGIRIKSSSELRISGTFQNETVSNRPKPRVKRDFQEKNSPSSFSHNVFDNSSPIVTGASVQLPDFVLPENLTFPAEISRDHILMFFQHYKRHCQTLVDVVHKHQFNEVEEILGKFWHGLPSNYRMIVQNPDMIDQIIEKDQITYKAMATVLLPNVLQALPVSIPQAIRHFAKQLEIYLSSALSPLGGELQVRKMHVAKKFSHSLHKQASLNHLTQAARAVLQNHQQVSQMIVDWGRLDFEFIRDQASWVCECGDDLIQSAQSDFKRFLNERASLEQWASWLQQLVNRILGPKLNDASQLLIMSQQLLLKWSFFSTMIIRDLTIRNATSFGSFHLLRTLFDEYIFYLVESKFASLSQSLYMNQSIGYEMENVGMDFSRGMRYSHSVSYPYETSKQNGSNHEIGAIPENMVHTTLPRRDNYSLNYIQPNQVSNFARGNRAANSFQGSPAYQSHFPSSYDPQYQREPGRKDSKKLRTEGEVKQQLIN